MQNAYVQTDSATWFALHPRKIASSPTEIVDFPKFIQHFRQQFTFKSVKVSGCRLWIHVPVPSDFSPFIASIKTFKFTHFHSTSIISASSLFTTFPGFTSVSQALSSPSTPSFHLNITRFLPTIATPASPGNKCDLIVPNVFIGDESTILDNGFLQKSGITAVVSFGGNPENLALKTFRVALDDSAFDRFDTDFWDAIEFVHKNLESGGRVLIHCRKGISRSPALCVAYLMEKTGLTFDAALDLVKAKRPAVAINPGFVDQLKARDAQNHARANRVLSCGKAR
jgi:hypothetical protein